MEILRDAIFVGVVSLGLGVGCAASTEPTPPRGDGETADGSGAASSGGAGTSVIGVNAGAASGTANGPSVLGGASAAGASSGVGGSFGTAGSSYGSAGTLGAGGFSDTGSAGASAGFTPAGSAVISVTSFSLTGCARMVSAADLAAKNDGLTAPKPTQTFSAGTLTVDYTVTGQYGQLGVDFPDGGVDLTGCALSATLSASSWPACGVYAVPFFFDGTLGTVAPYDPGAARFVGEQISNLNGASASITFKPTGAALTKVGRVGLNIYNCPSSVTVGDL